MATAIVRLGDLELLPLRCDKCGFIEFYDLALARSTPPAPELGVTETIPD